MGRQRRWDNEMEEEKKGKGRNVSRRRSKPWRGLYQ